MNITAGIVIYSLSLDTTIRTNIEVDQDFEIDSYELWEKGLPQNRVLYIVEKERLLRDLTIWRRKFILCAGWLDEEELEGQELYWICMSGSIGVHEIMGYVQQVFNRYYQWYIRLGTQIRKKESLSELLDTLDEVYKLTGCIATQSMRIV